MEITSTRKQGILQLGLQGRIDFSEAAQLERELSSLIAAGESQMVMDFSQVTFVSSHGLRVIMRFSRELSNRHGKLVLHSLSEDVRRSFDATGFAMILRISNTPDEAFAGVGNTGMLPACPIRR
ncbi:MAG: STAS domain-containing protein [Blastocatellia bacterium]